MVPWSRWQWGCREEPGVKKYVGSYSDKVRLPEGMERCEYQQ